MEKPIVSSGYQRAFDVIRRANQIAASTELDELLDHTLDLFVEVADAEAGTLYLYDTASDELIFQAVKGDAANHRLAGIRIRSSQCMAGAALHAAQPLFSPHVEDEWQRDRTFSLYAAFRPRTSYCLPLVLQQRSIGVVQVFNMHSTGHNEENEALMQLLSNCMTNAIEKARLLEEARQRERRQSALIDIISGLTSTLDRRELLTLIMNHARELLEVEATSVWELDQSNGVLIPHVITDEFGNEMNQLRVPVNQGIIGHVVATGESVQIEDVSKDQRHYREIDRKTGFETRSVLCVPLRAPSIQLGPERGTLDESIIGGAQALNKLNGGKFTAEDVKLFEVFATQAATVLQLARLYQETHELFLGVIKVVAGAIDAKDPYTQGHSQRVADFAVAIGEQLGLPNNEVYHVRIGGILHDVGKIGVPDSILQKQDDLDESEFDQIKKHPEAGYQIMSHAALEHLLKDELPALLHHHERLDGRGYPKGLVGDDISKIGRIVAVADVFDALTSDRPYRPGRPAEEAIAYLQKRAGIEFDATCVDALCDARAAGRIKTQREQAK